MTPDEAASILGVDKDAEVSEILATYSKKVQAVGADASQPGTQDPQVQVLVEARTTLMDDRRRRAATERRPRPSTDATPQYGQRAAATAAPAVSAWGDEPTKDKRLTPEQEATRKQRSLIIAIVGLVLSLAGWAVNPFFLFGLLAVVAGVWALIRVRGWGGGMYTVSKTLAWIAIISGVLVTAGTVLAVYFQP